MTAYYSAAYKTGSFPAITKDQLFMWSRTHPSSANAPDPVGKPTNFNLVSPLRLVLSTDPLNLPSYALKSQDAVWTVVMATEPSTVTLSTSPSNSQTFSVPAGLTKLSIPILPGGTMHGTIERNGQTLVDLQPDGFNFIGNPQAYNFNAFVAASD